MKTIAYSLMCMLFLSAGCEKASPGPESSEQVAISLHYDISIKDLKGNDLLNPENEAAIKPKDIDIYYLKGRVKEKVYHPNYDAPENFFIAQKEDGSGQYYMRVFVSDHMNSNSISTTYIEFDGWGTDTLTAKIHKQGAVTAATIAWYNGDLKIDTVIQSKSPRSFEIVINSLALSRAFCRPPGSLPPAVA